MITTNQPIKPTQPTNKQTNKTRTRLAALSPSLLVLVIAFLIYSLLPITYSLASDFAGSLKSVSITDPAGSNQPPVAVISYTQNGDTVTFDASGSTDPDGTIAEYKWDFGDGSMGMGNIVSHTFATGTYPVTLKVKDAEGGITISQNTLTVGCITDIYDDFTGTDLTKWSHLDGSTFSLDVTNDELDFPLSGSGVVVYSDEQTCSTSQWVAAHFSNLAAGNEYDGVYFRSTNNPGEPAYALRGNDNQTQLAWRYCYGKSCTTIATSNLSNLAVNDSLGVEVEGSGNDTIVRVWVWRAQGIPARGEWGAPSVIFTNDPPVAANTGKFVGLYTGNPSTAAVNNFQGGSF